MSTVTLGQIEALTKTYSDQRRALADRVALVEDEINAIKRKHLSALRRLVDAAGTAHGALAAAIEAAPGLFVQPRTIVLHGVKVGYTKGRGRLEMADPSKTVELIRKHFAARAEDLIKSREEPVKALLNQMSASDLRKIAVIVVDASDEVVVKATDGEIDKMVEALLAAATDASGAEG